jgi:hypothetical protein
LKVQQLAAEHLYSSIIGKNMVGVIAPAFIFMFCNIAANVLKLSLTTEKTRKAGLQSTVQFC